MENGLTELGMRLGKYLQYKRIGTNQLGRMMGSSGALASNILNGRNFGMNKFLAIGKACPDLNLCWLLTGQGKMLLEGKAEEAEAAVRKLEQSKMKAMEKRFLQDRLELKISSLERAVAYQEMAIDAYKSTLSAVLASHSSLKEVFEGHLKNIRCSPPAKKP